MKKTAKAVCFSLILIRFQAAQASISFTPPAGFSGESFDSPSLSIQPLFDLSATFETPVYDLFSQNFTSATDSYNVAVGANAGLSVTTGIQNTLIGGLAGDALTTGSEHVVLGYGALTDATTATGNVAIGHESSANITTGSNNVSVFSTEYLFNILFTISGCGLGFLTLS